MQLKTNKFFLTILVSLFVLSMSTNFLYGQTTVYTPEGRPVSCSTQQFNNNCHDEGFDTYDFTYYFTGDCYWANCHGYAFYFSEHPEADKYYGINDVDKFWTDQAYSNDGLASYIASAQSQATHILVCESGQTFPKHTMRKIKNSYPYPVQYDEFDVPYEYVSANMGTVQDVSVSLVQSTLNDHTYGGPNITYKYYKLKTNHYGTLYKYSSQTPTYKTWIGAGGITHTITNHLTVPDDVVLTLKAGCSVQFNSGKNMIIDNILISEVDLTIPTGSTLTINSGAQVIFAPGKKLIINGTLIANGATFTRSGSSGTWGGIQFNSGSSGSISYCTIEKAYYGIYCNGYMPTIQHNTIVNNYMGIYIRNAGAPTRNLTYNNIENNSYVGLQIYNSSPIMVQHNTISDNGAEGLYCTTYSSPHLRYNTITGNDNAGVYCIIFSSPAFTDRYRSPGYNLITQNYYGVTAGMESDVRIGTSSLGGYNSIYNNTSYEVTAGYDSHVMAEYNWWNRMPPTYPDYYYSGDFSTFMGATIDYIPALQSDPLGGMMKPAADMYDSELDDAFEKLYAGDYEYAINKYQQSFKEITEESKKKYILRRIAECYYQSGKNGFVDFLNTEIRPDLSEKDGLYASTMELENMFLMRDKKYDRVIDNLLILKNNFSDNETIIKSALYNLVCLNYDRLKYNGKWQGYMDELKQRFPEDALTFNAGLLTGEGGSLLSANSRIAEDMSGSEKVPEQYLLFNNFPNPFNPTTRIQFDLPEDNYVNLTVFNIKGQEIKKLVIGFKQAGSYQIEFDGSDLASGVYFYRLQAGDFVQTRRMLLIK
jgi:parallel beta-helix repeat protein